MHFRLFNKPSAFAIEAGSQNGKMYIDGIYEDYYPGEPYEGFVQVNGNVGLMKLRVIDANLPPGASVYIDQLTRRVMVKWSKYTPPTQEVTEVPNGSFESAAYWEIVGGAAPAKIETGWSPNGKGNLTYRDQKGDYTVRGAWAPVSSVNRMITIKGKVEHGKSSKGNASCAVGLSWYDADRNLIREDFGAPVTNGGKGRWYDASAAFASSDRAVKFVRPAIKFGRKKQNHPIHAGQITWDHAYTQGYDEDEQLFVEVEVTDSIHNKATHRGVIDENNVWITSRPYGYAMVDNINAQGEFGNSGGITSPRESIGSQGSFVSMSLEEVVKYRTYVVPAEAMPQSSGSFVSMATEEKVKYATYTIPADIVPQGVGSFVSMSSAVVNVNKQLPAENIIGAASFIKMEIT